MLLKASHKRLIAAEKFSDILTNMWLNSADMLKIFYASSLAALSIIITYGMERLQAHY
jgi:hypothetical protein